VACLEGEVDDSDGAGRVVTVPTPHEATVRALWLAHSANQIDAMLELVHPDVRWRPWSRPGLNQHYIGHDGIREMVQDLRAVHGHYWIKLHDITEVRPGFVVARGVVILVEERVEAPVEFRIAMLDGQVNEVDAVLTIEDRSAP
jgi:hypothetical protein